jgi:hypothetical protein
MFWRPGALILPPGSSLHSPVSPGHPELLLDTLTRVGPENKIHLPSLATVSTGSWPLRLPFWTWT